MGPGNLAELFERLPDGALLLDAEGCFIGANSVARAIVADMKRRDGLLDERDFADHNADWVDPISTNYRGYDVYDPANVGFVTEGFDTKRLGWKHDVAERGNGNQGHLYGTTLSSAEKTALLEYLKTL